MSTPPTPTAFSPQTRASTGLRGKLETLQGATGSSSRGETWLPALFSWQEDRQPPAERSPLPTPGRSWRGSAGNRPCALLAGLFLIRRTSRRRVCSDSPSWAARCSGAPCAGRRGGVLPLITRVPGFTLLRGPPGTRRRSPGKVSGRQRRPVWVWKTGEILISFLNSRGSSLGVFPED